MKLTSNKELYDYLLTFSSTLKSRKRERLSQLLTSASGHAAGMSTEFLGESRIALREVSREQDSALTREEQGQVLEVPAQLDATLDRR